ncbi:hypothetical protein JCM19231_1469 [Vibrio ishigakensis]|uniref:Uncharacterized protein n=1 Tax=Vibrio ishigakensis TaxID=1481914 RepID=A0A0B8NZB9_9VIBR|nr:hypothetical protein JCM19231_1469 [Vibrio ishigakensis]GAM66591.1 hypothetical protein JCM19236_4043 [Vibrio sp. JCM 19236]
MALTSAGEMLFHRAIEMLSIGDKIERELGSLVDPTFE